MQRNAGCTLSAASDDDDRPEAQHQQSQKTSSSSSAIVAAVAAVVVHPPSLLAVLLLPAAAVPRRRRLPPRCCWQERPTSSSCTGVPFLPVFPAALLQQDYQRRRGGRAVPGTRGNGGDITTAEAATTHRTTAVRAAALGVGGNSWRRAPRRRSECTRSTAEGRGGGGEVGVVDGVVGVRGRQAPFVQCRKRP